MNQRIILYERVQEEYDQFLQELFQLDEESVADRLHELILKLMIFEMIVEEMYTDDELKYLLEEKAPLQIIYTQLHDYIWNFMEYFVIIYILIGKENRVWQRGISTYL